MLPLSRYPPIPSDHLWFDVECERARGVELWKRGDLARAAECFVHAIEDQPECPLVYATYHRFLHTVNGASFLPTDDIIRVPESLDLLAAFSIYRFFGRCQIATAVAMAGWNGFEPPCPLVLARWVRAVGGTFCDVGANSGYYSLLATAAGAHHAIAFEPFAPAADIFRSNVELNRWSDRIDVRELAVGQREGRTKFYLPVQSHGLLETSASQDAGFRDEHSLEFYAEIIGLDSLLDELPRYENLTIKIDLEGVAPTLDVLNGAYAIARELRPLIMIEFLGGPAEGLHRFLAEMDYTSIVFRPNGQGVVEEQVTPQADQLNHFFVPNESIQTFVSAIGL